MSNYTLAQLQMKLNSQCHWEKYNVRSGVVELLKGKLIDVGTLPMCAETEYVRVECANSGKHYITVPAQIKEVLL